MNDKEILQNYLNKLYRIHDSISNLSNITYSNQYWICYKIMYKIKYIEQELGVIKNKKRLNFNEIFKNNFKYIKLED